MFEDLKNKIGTILGSVLQPQQINPVNQVNFQNVANKVQSFVQPFVQQLQNVQLPQQAPVSFASKVIQPQQINVADFIGQKLHDLSTNFNLPAPVQTQQPNIQSKLSTILSGLQPHINYLQLQQDIGNKLHQIDPTTHDPRAWINNAPILGGVRQFTYENLVTPEQKQGQLLQSKALSGQALTPQEKIALNKYQQEQALNMVVGAVDSGNAFKPLGKKLIDKFTASAEQFLKDRPQLNTPQIIGTAKRIANLEGKSVVDVNHLAESAQYANPTQEIARLKTQFGDNYINSPFYKRMQEVGAINPTANPSGQLIKNRGVGSYTNVASIDNRLLKGAQTVDQGVSPTIESTMNATRALRDPQGVTQGFEDIVRNTSTDVKSKINLLDYFRTPQNVLNKIGLGNEGKLIKQKYDDYLTQLPQEIQKISNWRAEVANIPNASQNIFRYLDGQTNIGALNPVELKVANEMKSYLASWADKLGLPQEKRITNYITHIWDKGATGKEFPDEIASLIRDKVAGSVYDPFVQARLGQQGYIEDAFKAVEAYTKRAVRKANLDVALSKIKDVSTNLEDSQFNYVKRYVDRINLRPTEIDTLVDNFIKSTPIGYKLGARPVASITRTSRQWVYRGLLGLNFHSALLNLTQGSNTFAKLGLKYTTIGYTKVLQNLPKIMAGADTELEQVGVLRNQFIQDQAVSSVKKILDKTDPAIFYAFQKVEVINRGSAYWGAKAQALNKGMTEEQAIKYAKDMVEKTQFTFGSVDTPVALQSDLAKTFAQFQNYGVKQGEFIGEMVKNKDVAGLVRYMLASFVMLETIGQVIGMKPTDLIPSFRFSPPTLQLPLGAVQAVTQSTDQFGNPLTPQERILNSNVVKGITNYVPIGGQIRKTAEGITAGQQGGSYTSAGNLRYPADMNLQNILMGTNPSSQAQNYYNNNISPLGSAQTAQYKQLIQSGMTPDQAYKIFTDQRAQDAQFKSLLNEQKSSSTSNNGLNFNLFGNNGTQNNVPTTSLHQTTSTTDPLMSLYANEKTQTEKASKIKQIFDLGLSQDQTDSILQKAGLGTYNDAKITILKSLNTESRASYIQQTLKGLSNGDYLHQVQTLADQKILTTAITSQWLDSGAIDQNQKKAIDNIISQSKGTYKGAPKPKVLIKPTLKMPKMIKVKKIKAVKLPTIKPLKPITTKKRSLAQNVALRIARGGL